MPRDDLLRNVFCVQGIPIDAISMSSVLHEIETAAAANAPFLISTPNINFLAKAQTDRDFLTTLLFSDLCTADGVPVAWIARLIGAPIKNRVAGSDVFENLKSSRDAKRPLTVFLFGGMEGVAAEACRRLNAKLVGLHCVGSLFPGFGSVADMSQDYVIDKINSSKADFLIVSLGAEKGQFWLHKNHRRLHVAVRAHLGAALNFEAGKVRRAPVAMRRFGLEWLWRIKEEPYLWRRYCNDGILVLRLLIARIFPSILWTLWLRIKSGLRGQRLVAAKSESNEAVTITLSGPAVRQHIGAIIPILREAEATGKTIIIDLSATELVDARFLGLLLMLRKKSTEKRISMVLVGLSFDLRLLFQLHGVEFLLSSGLN
jgi:N-acetylglucosaminyldiphosphoundecaprenol N-acetyl-beta-D-mannosaminyltransferase